MLTQEQVAQYQRDGFVKGGQVVDDQTLEILRSEMDRVMRDQKNPNVKQPVSICNYNAKQEEPIWQIIGMSEASQPYLQLQYNKRICEEVAQITGAEQLRIWHDQIQYKPSGKGGVNMWHQDSLFWATLMPKTTQLSAWVALDDVDEDNGCMSMVPGSHLWAECVFTLGVLPSFDALPKEFHGHRVEVRRCPVKKGEVHYHHAMTWHGSHANTSNRPRRAISIHYMTQDTLFNAKAPPNVITPFTAHLTHEQMMEGEHFPLVWERAAAAVGALR